MSLLQIESNFKNATNSSQNPNQNSSGLGSGKNNSSSEKNDTDDDAYPNAALLQKARMTAVQVANELLHRGGRNPTPAPDFRAGKNYEGSIDSDFDPFVNYIGFLRDGGYHGYLEGQKQILKIPKSAQRNNTQ